LKNPQNPPFPRSRQFATGGQHPSVIPPFLSFRSGGTYTHLLPPYQSPNLLVVIPTDEGAEEPTPISFSCHSDRSGGTYTTHPLPP